MKIKSALPALALAIICSAFLSPQWALADVGEGEATAPAASSAQEVGESVADDQAQTAPAGQTGESAAPAQPEVIAPPSQDASAPGDAQDPNDIGAQATEPSDTNPEATIEPGQAPEAAPSDDPDSGESPGVSSDDLPQAEPGTQPEAAAPEPSSPETASDPSQDSTAAEMGEAVKPAADVALNSQAEPKGTTAKPAASTPATSQAKPKATSQVKPKAQEKMALALNSWRSVYRVSGSPSQMWVMYWLPKHQPMFRLKPEFSAVTPSGKPMWPSSFTS